MSQKQGPGAQSDVVRIAVRAIEFCVREGCILDAQQVADLETGIEGNPGVFVCIKKGGELRGCIGTFRPTQNDVVEEIIHNAASSCTRDPRFYPVSPEELADLDVSVDVLSTPEKVADISRLDPKRYGVIVQAGARVGLLLPDLEGVDDVETQLGIARQKAGIRPEDPVEIYRFTVDRYY